MMFEDILTQKESELPDCVIRRLQKWTACKYFERQGVMSRGCKYLVSGSWAKNCLGKCQVRVGKNV